MIELDVAKLSSVLNYTPLVFEGEPLLLAELDEVSVEPDLRRYVQAVDDVMPVPNERTVLLGPVSSYFDRWPAARVADRVPSDLAYYNRQLFRNFDQVQSYAFKQSDIARLVMEDLDVDVVVLLLIDGLSYIDWASYDDVRACLVDGPSITPVGFQNVVNQPSIAHRLFRRGFSKRIGFTYWDRSNELTDILFRGFDAATQMIRVTEFRETLLALDRLRPGEQTFIQIIVNGLDSVSHRHRERPAVAATARHLYENLLMAIVETLERIGVTAVVYATADHGILWKPEPGTENGLVVVSDERATSRRYTKGSFIAPNSRQITSHGTK